ncbi:MAG: hypothetical protein RL722_35 [Pseudomonadota bacterium]|jgi:cyclopropane-fatty-acyl-phospholipid synthase
MLEQLKPQTARIVAAEAAGLMPGANLPAQQNGARLPWRDHLPAAARQVIRLLEGISHGRLELRLPGALQIGLGERGSDTTLQARMVVNDWAVFEAVLRSGDIGLAESFIAGHWESPDLPALLKLFLANRAELETAIYGRWWGGLWHRLRHLFLNRNSLAGSRRNISAHYDLGNPFYRTWLDAGMNYSSALFEGQADRDLASAQQAKLGRALAAVQIKPGQRLLEIGCGWGGLAELAGRRGMQVTGLTLSQEQLDWARRRMTAASLTSRVDLRLQDYRLVDEAPFDGIVSIEMFEAVGRTWWPTYFRTVARCLKPGGRACIQTITIADGLFERYARSTDFIQQYIFPGGMLPSPALFRQEAEQAGLVVEEAFSFGPDYAETLRRWRQAFQARREKVAELGYDEFFLRTWDFYLAYCEAGFDAGNTDVVQFTLRRP